MIKRFKDAIGIGDIHFPYEHKPTVKRIIDYVAWAKPFNLVQIGDLYDFFWFSRYTKKWLPMTPKEEVELGRERAESFWKTIQRVSPRTKIWQLLGNHDERPYKRLLERAPELEVFFQDTFTGLFKFKGIETVLDPKQELYLPAGNQQVMWQHGHRSMLGDHMKYNETSTVVGHSHVGGVVYKQYKNETKWELNVGYTADPDQGPLQYGSQKKKFWTHGVGHIDQHGPRFIPLLLKK